MSKKQIKWLSFFIILTLVVILFDSQMLSQPSKLKGNFKEVAFYRNENNDGPVIRIYSVTVENPEGANYKGYGDAMPYTLHGNTKVYFFDIKHTAPTQLRFNYPHFDTSQYKPIKIYERNGADQKNIRDF